MSPATRRSQLLKLLQDFLHQHPGKPVSFVVLANELGCSRQHIRTLYYQLKTQYPVPPVVKRGSDAITRKKKLIASTGGKRAHALGKAHSYCNQIILIFAYMTDQKANEIIKSFSRTLIQVQKFRLVLCPQAFPQSVLEHPKEEIELALTGALNYAYLSNDRETADLLKQ